MSSEMPHPVSKSVCSVCDLYWPDHVRVLRERYYDQFGEAPGLKEAQDMVTPYECIALLKRVNQGPQGPQGAMGMRGDPGPKGESGS